MTQVSWDPYPKHRGHMYHQNSTPLAHNAFFLCAEHSHIFDDVCWICPVPVETWVTDGGITELWSKPLSDVALVVFKCLVVELDIVVAVPPQGSHLVWLVVWDCPTVSVQRTSTNGDGGSANMNTHDSDTEVCQAGKLVTMLQRLGGKCWKESSVVIKVFTLFFQILTCAFGFFRPCSTFPTHNGTYPTIKAGVLDLGSWVVGSRIWCSWWKWDTSRFWAHTWKKESNGSSCLPFDSSIENYYMQLNCA